MLIYERSSGMIVADIPKGQPYEYLYDVPLGHLELDEYPSNIFDYRILNDELIPLSDVEIRERLIYGKLLTDDERDYNNFKSEISPSKKELEQAELMIKLLPILQEVMKND